MMHYSNRMEWSEGFSDLTSNMAAILNDFQRHHTNTQIAIMQPRCRKCYRAGIDVKHVNLSPCPRCSGVALCHDCLREMDVDPEKIARGQFALFHPDATNNNPAKECDQHLLSLCSMGVVIEQGNPLGIPSNSDSTVYWAPKDWKEYFVVKRHDYDVPEYMFHLAPIPGFLSDAHSMMLTIHHVMSLLSPSEAAGSNIEDTLGKVIFGEPASARTKLIVHVVGAAVDEEKMVGRHVELIRLNPQFESVEIHLIGPDVHVPNDELISALQIEKVRSSCIFSVTSHKVLYHNFMDSDSIDAPTIVFCQHPGMHDGSYRESWRPTIQYMAEHLKDVPIISTGYNQKEVILDSELLHQWGLSDVLVPPTPNPFRGLRPFLDPGRDPADVIYTNASFAVMRAKS
jgi:hypothetical protein